MQRSVHCTWRGECESITTQLHKPATDKNEPHLCDFIATHYLDEQVKSTTEPGDYITNLSKMGAPKSGMGEYLLGKGTVTTRAKA